MRKEIEVTRKDGDVVAVIQGWNDTHVLFDVWDVIERKWSHTNFSRPIRAFMLDYGLA